MCLEQTLRAPVAASRQFAAQMRLSRHNVGPSEQFSVRIEGALQLLRRSSGEPLRDLAYGGFLA
jgi:hypothetical protein